MKEELNPFISVGYRGPSYFCDRKNESSILGEFMREGRNVTLFAMRRIGKTGLINHVFYPHRQSRKLICIYVDILPTNDLRDFTNLIATAVYNRFPPRHSIGKKVMSLFQRFRPTIAFDELTGSPALSLTIDTKSQKENTITNILKFLDEQGVRIVFAIDEFQQILEYPEKNTEALLRSCIQQLKNTSFIFCGSNQQMMHEIFNSAKRPFYASCVNMNLDYISEKAYSRFIRKKFEERNRIITEECLEFICSWTKLHTFYVQQLCYTLYAFNRSENDLNDAHEAALAVLKLNESNFFQYRNLLTSAQWNLLTAIAKEEQVIQPQSKKLIGKHQLGTPALVKRGLDALIKKELVFYNSGVEKPYYEVYDKYLMRWIQMKY